MDGRLAAAIRVGAADLVRINEVKLIQFNLGCPSVLGVNGLSACSVVAIVSPHAAIVAHIGPNILGSDDPYSFIQLAKSKMDETAQLYRNNGSFFPNASTYIVCAMLNGNALTAPEHIKIIHSNIKQLNLSSAQIYYEQTPEIQINATTPCGTVLVDGRDATPKVYVEDRDVTATQQKSPIWQMITEEGIFQYCLMLDTNVLVKQGMPPANENIWMVGQGRWVQWNGSTWVSQ